MPRMSSDLFNEKPLNAKSFLGLKSNSFPVDKGCNIQTTRQHTKPAVYRDRQEEDTQGSSLRRSSKQRGIISKI